MLLLYCRWGYNTVAELEGVVDAYADAGLPTPLIPRQHMSCSVYRLTPCTVSKQLHIVLRLLQAFLCRQSGRTSTTWRRGATSHGLMIATHWTSIRLLKHVFSHGPARQPPDFPSWVMTHVASAAGTDYQGACCWPALGPYY